MTHLSPTGASADAERANLEQTIAALEAQRAVLGDAVVDTAIAPLREKLTALESPVTAMPDLFGERKQITIVLADVKGSTDLAERLNIEHWVEVMNHLLKLLEAEVYRFGGVVNQFRGDGLLAFFGTKHVREDDPERAILAALAMLQAVKPYAVDIAAREGVQLQIRVGVNTGEVIVTQVGDQRQYSEDTAMGRAVAIAARMESSADPGTVLVTEAAYRLTHAQFKWESLGAISVKGIHQPVNVYRPLYQRTLPGKSRGIPGLVSPLIGRQTEMQALQSVLTVMDKGSGGIVTLVGEAGMGKSRLVAEVQQWAQREFLSETGAHWLEGRCVSYGASSAYFLWVDILRQLFSWNADAQKHLPDIDETVLQAQVARFCPDTADEVFVYVEQLLAVGADLAHVGERALQRSVLSSVPDAVSWNGAQFKQGVFATVEQVLRGAVRLHPLVIVCEDLHWADATSLELLAHLFPLTRELPLCFVCVFRPEEQHSCWQLLTLAADYHYVPLALHPLSGTHSQTLLGHLLCDNGLPAALKGRIFTYADGNPFYMEEIVRTLMDDGAITYDVASGQWRIAQRVDNIAIPETLRGVLVARIDRLPQATKRILQVASVIGRIFSERVLMDVVALVDDALFTQNLDEHLALLTQMMLIRERDTEGDAGYEREYIFKHHLTQQATYYSLLERERETFHQYVAEVLKRLFVNRLWEFAELLAYHWEHANQPGRTIPHLIRAADKASFRFANEEALVYLNRALTAAHSAKLALAEAEVLNRLSYVCRHQGDYAQARAHLEKTLAIYQGFGNQRRVGNVLMELGILTCRQGAYDKAHKFFEQALQTSRLVGNRQGEANALTNLGVVACDLGAYQEAEAYFQQALRFEKILPSWWNASGAWRGLGTVHRHLGDFAVAATYFEKSLHHSRAVKDQRGESATLTELALLLCCQTDHAAALTHAEQALRLAEMASVRAHQAAALLVIGHALVGLTRLVDAEFAYQQSITIRQALGEHHLALEARAGLAQIALMREDMISAQRLVTEILSSQGERFLGTHFLGARYLESNPTFNGTAEPLRIYWICYRVLQAVHSSQAKIVLQVAVNLLQERANNLTIPELRASFLEKVSVHHNLMKAWLAYCS